MLRSNVRALGYFAGAADHAWDRDDHRVSLTPGVHCSHYSRGTTLGRTSYRRRKMDCSRQTPVPAS